MIAIANKCKLCRLQSFYSFRIQRNSTHNIYLNRCLPWANKIQLSFAKSNILFWNAVIYLYGRLQYFMITFQTYLIIIGFLVYYKPGFLRCDGMETSPRFHQQSFPWCPYIETPVEYYQTPDHLYLEPWNNHAHLVSILTTVPSNYSSVFTKHWKYRTRINTVKI